MCPVYVSARFCARLCPSMADCHWCPLAAPFSGMRSPDTVSKKKKEDKREGYRKAESGEKKNEERREGAGERRDHTEESGQRTEQRGERRRKKEERRQKKEERRKKTEERRKIREDRTKKSELFFLNLGSKERQQWAQVWYGLGTTL